MCLIFLFLLWTCENDNKHDNTRIKVPLYLILFMIYKFTNVVDDTCPFVALLWCKYRKLFSEMSYDTTFKIF